MKLKVHQPGKEREVYLSLNETLDGVSLVAVNSDGSFIAGGKILTVGEKGICLHRRVSKNIGLPRKTDGTIITKENDTN